MLTCTVIDHFSTKTILVTMDLVNPSAIDQTVGKTSHITTILKVIISTITMARTQRNLWAIQPLQNYPQWSMMLSLTQLFKTFATPKPILPLDN